MAGEIPQSVELPWGRIEFSNNEVSVISTVDDPPGFRFASLNGTLGKVSFNLLRPDGSQDELVLVQGKKDERTRSRTDVNYGEFSLHIKGPKRYDGDDGMYLLATLLHDYIWLKGINGPAPQPPALALPEPTETTPATDPWLTSEAQAKHQIELSRIEAETGLRMDEDRYRAYMTGRNKNLAEVHDDEVNRSGLSTDPCAGRNRNPL